MITPISTNCRTKLVTIFKKSAEDKINPLTQWGQALSPRAKNKSYPHLTHTANVYCNQIGRDEPDSTGFKAAVSL